MTLRSALSALSHFPYHTLLSKPCARPLKSNLPSRLPQLTHPKMAESFSHLDSSRLPSDPRSGLSLSWDSRIFTACLASLHRSSPGPQIPERSTLSPVSKSFQAFSLHPCTCAHRKYITLHCSFNFLHKRYHSIWVLSAGNGVPLTSFCQDSQTWVLLACSL